MATSEVIFASDEVIIGRFQVSPEQVEFSRAGTIDHPTVVFPRLSVSIQHETTAPLLIDINHASLYNRNADYQRLAIDHEGDRCDWFELQPTFFRRRFPRLCEDKPFSLPRLPISRHHYVRQRRLVQALELGAPKTEVLPDIIDLLVDLVSSASTEDAPTINSEQQTALTETVRLELASHFTSDLSLETLESTLGLSRYHLARTFKSVTGTSVHQYKTELRLRRSLEMITQYRDLTDVALSLGYSSHAHFTAAFKRAFGSSPRHFRNELSPR